MYKLILIVLLLAALAAHAAPVMVVDSQPEYWLPLDAGWSVLLPSQNSRIVYVSSSLGNDAWSGLQPIPIPTEAPMDGPVASLGKAVSLVRSSDEWWLQPGYISDEESTADTVQWFPDWILLRRGDSWAGSLVVRRGESASNPFVWGAYG